jgi:hypothetical protein
MAVIPNSGRKRRRKTHPDCEMCTTNREKAEKAKDKVARLKQDIVDLEATHLEAIDEKNDEIAALEEQVTQKDTGRKDLKKEQNRSKALEKQVDRQTTEGNQYLEK